MKPLTLSPDEWVGYLLMFSALITILIGVINHVRSDD